jgi:hypothetical protein
MKGKTFFLTVRTPYSVDGIMHMHLMHCVCEVTAFTDTHVEYAVLNVRSQEDIPPLTIAGGRKPLPKSGGMTRDEWDRLGLGRQP